MGAVGALADFVSAELTARADVERARQMAAYMKTDQPFYGVPAPERRAVLREARRRHPLPDVQAFRDEAGALWERPHREEQHCAVDLAVAERRWIHIDQLDLYRRFIVEGAWWDFVDVVTANLVGQVLRDEPEAMWPILDEWVDDDDLWLRRSAVLAQLKQKDRTDTHRLFGYCLRRAADTDFFIRKAIGWALREYAKTNPEAVRRFLAEHRDRLSPLSLREAGKHL